MQEISAIRKVHRVHEDEITCVIFCNWSAPTVLTAEGQRRQASLLASLVNRGSSHNLGLLFTPSFSNKKGLLWKEEELARSMLSNANCNTDTHVVLTFGVRHDLRDQRTETLVRQVLKESVSCASQLNHR